MLLASTAAAVMLGACGGSRQPSANAAATGAPAAASADSSAPANDTVTADTSSASAEQQAALDAREQELARREAELAKSEAAVAATRTQAQTPPKTTKSKSPASSASSDSVIAKQPSATLASNSSPMSRSDSTVSSAGGPQTYVVPAGTTLQIELTQGVNTKKVKVGDTVAGRLHAPVMVGGTNAVESGSQVTGTVTQVVSGSAKIGGVPTLGLTFDSLVAENGSHVPISAKFLQQGTSDTMKDTAKIAGGAAAGAVIGHQVGDDNKGTIIGGLLGGAAGAAAAQKTGGEVKLPNGTVIAVTADTSFTVER